MREVDYTPRKPNFTRADRLCAAQVAFVLARAILVLAQGILVLAQVVFAPHEAIIQPRRRLGASFTLRVAPIGRFSPPIALF